MKLVLSRMNEGGREGGREGGMVTSETYLGSSWPCKLGRPSASAAGRGWETRFYDRAGRDAGGRGPGCRRGWWP